MKLLPGDVFSLALDGVLTEGWMKLLSRELFVSAFDDVVPVEWMKLFSGKEKDSSSSLILLCKLYGVSYGRLGPFFSIGVALYAPFDLTSLGLVSSSIILSIFLILLFRSSCFDSRTFIS